MSATHDIDTGGFRSTVHLAKLVSGHALREELKDRGVHRRMAEPGSADADESS